MNKCNIVEQRDESNSRHVVHVSPKECNCICDGQLQPQCAYSAKNLLKLFDFACGLFRRIPFKEMSLIFPSHKSVCFSSVTEVKRFFSFANPLLSYSFLKVT